MRRVLLVAGLFPLIFFSGCFQKDNGEPSETSPTGTGPTGGGGVTSLSVRILNFTDSAKTGDAINVTWRVESNLNDSVPLTHTGVHWGNASVPAPNETAGEEYGHAAGESEVATTGTFNTTFTVDTEGTVYLRAHAEVGSNYSWSEEVQVNVTKKGMIHTVTIGAAAVGYLAEFSPNPVNVKVGDSVKWKNDDDVDHTATADDDSFDTGNVAAGGSSGLITFTRTGTFDYHCEIHPQTMMGQVVVSA